MFAFKHRNIIARGEYVREGQDVYIFLFVRISMLKCQYLLFNTYRVTLEIDTCLFMDLYLSFKSKVIFIKMAPVYCLEI